MQPTTIYTSKKKSLKLLLISLLFVILGFWFVMNPETFDRNPTLLRALGIISILFFGLGLLISLKQILSKELALVIDAKGLNIHPKKSKEKYIPWHDVSGFETLKVKGQKFILIHVKNPQDWLAKEKNLVRKKLMAFNINEYGTPFNLGTHSWDIRHGKLLDLLNNYLRKQM